MIFFISLAFMLISSAYGAGEFTVLHHAPSLLFKGHDTIKESTLKEVYAAALGFSTEHFSNWRGMYLSDPFGVAQAIVTVFVNGVSDIDQQRGHTFPVNTDMGESKIYKSLERRIGEHHPEQSTNIVRIHLSNGLEDIHNYPIFEDILIANPKQINYKSLKLDVEEDRKFDKEITILDAVATKVGEGVIKRDNVPDFYWFEVSSLHALTDFYGENSTQVLEAKQLLNEVISRINEAFKKVYDGQVLVTVLTSDASHTRRGRSIMQAKNEKVAAEKSDKIKYNLASYYSKDYPVIFNIVLWFGIMMLFSLIAICLAIGSMDPGRDSIIYRMTSTRMKKDN